MKKLAIELNLAILARLEGDCECCSGPFRGYYHFNRLAQYATISRQWQHLIETYTFRHLKLTSRDPISGKAASILTPFRLKNAQTVDVAIYLELHDLVEEGKLDGEDLEPYAHHIFTKTVKSLFHILKTVPARVDHRIALTLRVEPIGYWGGPHDCPRGSVEDLERRHVYLNMENDEQLPVLPMVSSLNIPMGSYERFLSPRSIFQISSSLPEVKQIHISLSDMERNDIDLRNRIREDFPHGLETLPKSVTSFDLMLVRSMSPYRIIDEVSLLPLDSEGRDSLSHALYLFSQRPGFLSFNVCGIIDASIFTPTVTPGGTAWMNLRYYGLELHGVTLTGASPALPPHDSEDESDSDTEDEDWGEDLSSDESSAPTVDQSLIKPFWLAAGKAVSQMPALKRFELRVHGYEWFDFVWQAPEQSSDDIFETSLQEAISAHIQYLNA